MSKGHSHKSRYAHLVSAFAASAFALLITLSAQLQTASTATASAVTGAVTLTNYQTTKCPYKPTDRGYRTKIKSCSTRGAIRSAR
ncbi:hypothetical protein K8942_05430 [Candidatus Peribacteria bacterium]|nr:MAG: hypothetical protein K8942_05430 [Candidatus Peribacteria bacterium]